jgi:hypothetical protein
MKPGTIIWEWLMIEPISKYGLSLCADEAVHVYARQVYTAEFALAEGLADLEHAEVEGPDGRL